MDLDLVSTDDLLDQLAVRFDVMIFAGVKTFDGERQQVQRRSTGDWWTQMGLAFDFATRVRDQLDAEQVDDRG